MALLESFAESGLGGSFLTMATTHHGELKTLKYRLAVPNFDGHSMPLSRRGSVVESAYLALVVEWGGWQQMDSVLANKYLVILVSFQYEDYKDLTLTELDVYFLLQWF